MSDGLDPSSLGTHAGTGVLGGVVTLAGFLFNASRKLKAEEVVEAAREKKLDELAASVVNLATLVGELTRKVDRLLDQAERAEKDDDHRDAMLEEVRRELAEVDKRLSRLEDRAAPRTGEFTKAGP